MMLFFAAGACSHAFFFIPNWWEFLPADRFDASCVVSSKFIFPNDILPISLAVVDMILRLAGLVAIISIIVAGVMYMSAGGDFQKTAAAKHRIYNSVIGLGIAALAAATVGFIGNSLS